MGITPITSLLPLPVARAIQADLDPLPMARVENSARSGDETYSPGNGKLSDNSEQNGSGDDGSEDTALQGELAGLGSDDEQPGLEDEDGAEAIGKPGDGRSQPHPISFFA